MYTGLVAFGSSDTVHLSNCTLAHLYSDHTLVVLLAVLGNPHAGHHFGIMVYPTPISTTLLHHPYSYFPLLIPPAQPLLSMTVSANVSTTVFVVEFPVSQVVCITSLVRQDGDSAVLVIAVFARVFNMWVVPPSRW